ncbi:MAG: hypothetical protein WA996_25725 [Candidatus Promineifilaceae bacterium]
MEGQIIRKLWPFLAVFFLVVGVFAVYAVDDGTQVTEEVPRLPRSPNQNLLANPSFEGSYSSYIPPFGNPDCPSGICQTAQMATGWTPYWKSHNPADDPWIFRMPEYKPAELNIPPPPRVRSGERAQQYFTFYSTHIAGIYQQVTVEPGRQYCFTVWGHSWSSTDDNSQTSDSPLIQKIGIDPFGGTSWESGDIIWGRPTEQYNEYGLFYVCSVAQTNHLTVFTFSEPVWAAKHNDVYWDDAELMLYEAEMMIPQIDGISFLADVNDPELVTRDLVIDIPNDPWVSWTARIESGGTIVPTLSATGGTAGDDLMITVDSNGLPVGFYSAEITITSTPWLAGSPATIPLTLVIAAEIHFNGLAFLTSP